MFNASAVSVAVAPRAAISATPASREESPLPSRYERTRTSPSSVFSKSFPRLFRAPIHKRTAAAAMHVSVKQRSIQGLMYLPL